MRTLLVLVLSLALSACSTSLSSNQWSGAQIAVPSGNMYYLPATQIHGSISFIPTSCKIVDGAPKFEYEIIDSTISSSTVADIEQHYYIDYLKLNSAAKTTSASFDFYPIGTLKSVNAEIEDRTAETLGAIAGAALNIVRAAAFVPGMGVADVEPDENYHCAKAINRLLVDLRKYRSLLADLANEDDVAAGTVHEKQANTRTEKAPASTRSALISIKDKNKNKNKKIQAIHSGTALETASPATPTADMVQKRIAVILQGITAPARFSYIPTLSKKCSDVSLSWASYLEKLLDLAKSAEYDELDTVRSTMQSQAAFKAVVCVPSATATRRTKLQQLSVSTDAAGNSLPAPRMVGILYRQPVSANVTVAKSEQLPAVFSSDSPVSMPQYGTMASLDLVNDTFDKNSLKANFAPDGALTYFAFSTQSSAERGTAALQALSSTYGDISMARDKAAAARAKTMDEQSKKSLEGQIDAYDARLRLLTAQEAFSLKAAGKTQAQLEIDDLERKTVLIKKKIDYENALRAQKKLEEVAQ